MVSGSSSSVDSLLDSLQETTEGGGGVALGEIIEAIGDRSYGPLLLVPALVEMSPLGGIPGVPTVLALIILIFAVQIVIGRQHLWLPRMLGDRKVSTRRLEKSLATLRPVARHLDRWFGRRLQWLAGAAAVRAAAVTIIVLCLSVPPLELLPFASAAPMLAIAMFGLAMTVKDGALMLGGFVVTVVGILAAAGIAF
jgi:hypothetical protein